MIYCKNYINEISNFSKSIDTSFLKNTKVLISGGTGLIGSYLIDTLLSKPELNVNITCLCLNKEQAQQRFSIHNNDNRLSYFECDLTKNFTMEDKFDYIVHLASFSDAHNYAKYPVETMLMNFWGCRNLLEIAKTSNCKKFFYASSSEIYGTSSEEMNEYNFGIVNTLDIRSCYNESKRASETLCISYYNEFNVNTVIGRFCRIYGPSMLIDDSKALSQFLKNALNNEDIVLKSKGDQELSYCYVSDAVNGILTLLNKGKNANAYNISNNIDTPTLKEIAEYTASLKKRKVIFDTPSDLEKKGYSRVSKAILPTTKLESLGWKPTISIFEGIQQTYSILETIYNR